MMNHHSNTSSNHPRFPSVCGQCGIDEPKFLHNVRHRGNFRRLCTTCVLRLHPQCFCPACLGVYDRSPPIDAVVCYKCYSSSHPSCVLQPPAGTVTSSRSSSPCSACLNPNLLVLNVNRPENGGRVIDVTAAKLLLAAGKIAAMSMSKAEVAAAMEAERRAKEAAYTKKRAREALDHVVSLMAVEKRNQSNNKKVFNVNNGVLAMPLATAASVDATVVPLPVAFMPSPAAAVNDRTVIPSPLAVADANTFIPSPPVVADAKTVMSLPAAALDANSGMPKPAADANFVISPTASVLDANSVMPLAATAVDASTVMPSVAVGNAHTVKDKVDASNEVVEAMNAVELKEIGRQSPVAQVESGVGEPQGDGAVAMVVDVVNGEGSGVDSVAENGSVKNDDSNDEQNCTFGICEFLVPAIDELLGFTSDFEGACG